MVNMKPLLKEQRTTIMAKHKLIRDNHMFYRCNVMFLMCGLSLYGWYNNSIFDFPLVNNIYSPYYINSCIFIAYLLWDTYKMLLSKNRAILYRNDLVIHHVVNLVIYSNLQNNSIQGVYLFGSHFLLAECISVFNYVLREPQWSIILNYYRLGCIMFIRMPIWLLMYLYYFPYVYSYSIYVDYNERLVVWYLKQVALFFILYDAYLLKQIVTNCKVFSYYRIR